jgi:hypothetical protein
MRLRRVARAPLRRSESAQPPRVDVSISHPRCTPDELEQTGARLRNAPADRSAPLFGALHGSSRAGSTIATPAESKSRRLRVATARSCASAVAAIKLSLIGIARPSARSPASISAQRSPVEASHGMHCNLLTPSSNQRSSRLLRRPRGSRSMPKRISPRMTGSTASSGSLRASQSTTRRSGAGLVASESTFASTR